ncbi:MAG: signal recognition particle-docking protein FtsY [Desulfotignum sp.]|nr:signal recognition particle-docking protein FtsY [Desulfotignum sp.]
MVFNFFKRKTKEKEQEQEQEKLKEQERLKEQENLREQERLKEEENLREQERLEEEENLREQERLEQEEKIKEQERLKEEARLKEENRSKETTSSETPQRKGLFNRLKSGLTKTRDVLNTDINDLFRASRRIDEDLFDELEEVLITADLGMDITMEMMDRIRKQAGRLSTADQLKAVLKKELIALFPPPLPTDAAPALPRPHVIMVVGVNGTGKTTTLGKLAARFTRENKRVLIAAADTFRAAAIEQVGIWADRAGASIVRHKQGADPAAVAYDGVEAAMARGVDVLLIDTAGRLHTQKNLMEELKKIKRTVAKKMPGAPHEVLMVLDATTGQNAISQAKMFHQAVTLTQLALTKLDGTAKGGIVAAVAGTMHLPIRYIGVGETMDDLQAFDATRFVNALFD